jgi:hypothetical protein
MQIRLLILFILAGFGLNAQVWQLNSAPYNYAKGLRTDSLFLPARGCDTTFMSRTKYGASTTGAIYTDTCNNRVYQRTATAWVLIGGSSVTPSALTKTNDTNITIDFAGNNTVALLSPVQLIMGWTGTLADSRISSAATWNAKLNANDTTQMLAPYFRAAGVGLLSTGQVVRADTGRGTVQMVTGGGLNKVADSLGAIIATKGTGTVTSVATGLGLSGGTITTSGTVVLDTASASVISRQRTAAQYGALTSHNFWTTRNSFQSLTINKDSIPITTSNVWALTLDTSASPYRVQRRSLATMVTTLGAIGSSANANGATITNNTLNLEPASGSFGGVLTTGLQTIAGQKTWSNSATFGGNITMSSNTSTLQAFNIESTSTRTLELNGQGQTTGKTYSLGLQGQIVSNGAGGIKMYGTYSNSATTGGVSFLKIEPDFTTTTGGATSYTGIDYNPTLTGVTLPHYAAVFRSGTVGIGSGTPGASVLFDVNTTTKASNPYPRMTSSQRTAISSPATGAGVFDTDSSSLMIYNGARWQPQDKADYINSTLGSPVTMTTAATFYTGAMVALTAGTWLLVGQITFTVPGSAGTHTIEGRIYNGSAAVASGNQVVPASGQRPATMALNTVVVITGNTTYTLDLTSNVNSGQINAVTVTSSQAAATQLTATRIR